MWIQIRNDQQCCFTLPNCGIKKKSNNRNGKTKLQSKNCLAQSILNQFLIHWSTCPARPPKVIVKDFQPRRKQRIPDIFRHQNLASAHNFTNSSPIFLWSRISTIHYILSASRAISLIRTPRSCLLSSTHLASDKQSTIELNHPWQIW